MTTQEREAMGVRVTELPRSRPTAYEIMCLSGSTAPAFDAADRTPIDFDEMLAVVLKRRLQDAGLRAASRPTTVLTPQTWLTRFGCAQMGADIDSMRTGQPSTTIASCDTDVVTGDVP